MHDGVHVSSQAFFTIISHVTVKMGTIVSSPSLSAATGVFVVLSSPSLSPLGVHVVVDHWWCFEAYERSYFPETQFITITPDLRPPSSHLTLPAGRYIAVSF